jgi:hypothetical protein
MLQSIRDRTQGWITSTIIGLLIIVFALWGIHGYLELNAGDNNKIVAKVAGQVLLQSDFDKAYQRAFQEAQDRLGVKFSNTKKMVEQLKQQTLLQWETTQVLSQAALQSKYRIGQALVDSVLLQIPAFQSTGRFSVERFYTVLNAINYTKLQFLTDIKKSLLINQVQQGITQSAFALPQDINNSIKFTQQKRDFAYIIIPYSRFLNKQSSISDAQIFTYYQQNKQDFSQPEQVSIEYIELSLNDGRNGNIFAETRDKLANLAYTHPDSLDFVAKKLSLSIQSTPFFDRSGGQEGLIKDPKIIAAACNKDVLQGNNSSVININPNKVIVLRIKKYQPPTIQPLDAVRESIKIALTKQMAISQAQQLGENLLKKIEKDGSTIDNSNSKNLKWQFIKNVNRYDEKLNKHLLNAAFKLVLPKKNTPYSSALTGFSLVSGDYALVRLIAVYNEKDLPAPTIPTQKLYREELAKSLGQLDYVLYTHNLLKKAKLV